MGMFDSLISLRSARHVNALAEEIVQRCWPFIWGRVREKAVLMTPAQARGYVRAHGGELVRASVSSSLRDHEALGPWAADMVTEQALDGVVRRFIQESLRLQQEQARQTNAQAA